MPGFFARRSADDHRDRAGRTRQTTGVDPTALSSAHRATSAGDFDARSDRRRTVPPSRASRTPRPAARAWRRDDRTASRPRASPSRCTRSAADFVQRPLPLDDRERNPDQCDPPRNPANQAEGREARRSLARILGRRRRSIVRSPAADRHRQRGHEPRRTPTQTGPPERNCSLSELKRPMTGPGRQAPQVTSLVCQERPVAAMRVNELKPRPVDERPRRSRREVPSPRWRPSTSFAIPHG